MTKDEILQLKRGAMILAHAAESIKDKNIALDMLLCARTMVKAIAELEPQQEEGANNVEH